MQAFEEKTPDMCWHALDGESVLKAVGSQVGGLTQDVAAQRLALYGPNHLRPPQKNGAWRRFLTQFHNVLIYILLGAGVVTAILGHWVDTGVILGVVVINAIIGFIQEGKAEKAMDQEEFSPTKFAQRRVHHSILTSVLRVTASSKSTVSDRLRSINDVRRIRISSIPGWTKRRLTKLDSAE